jgi:hypothetical protein
MSQLIRTKGPDEKRYFAFPRPSRAFYSTCREWTRDKINQITEDNAYVMKRAPYRPIPFDLMGEVLLKLSNLDTLEIAPAELKEPLDYDPILDSVSKYAYLLCDSVLMRFRDDDTESSRVPEDILHTFMLVGDQERIVNLTERLGLPHPYDKSLYPFKSIFRGYDRNPEVLYD